MKQTNSTFLSILLLSTTMFSSVATADTIGVYVGAGQWNLDYSGSISQGTDSINLTSDLGLKKEAQTTYFIAIEHPVPFIPNFKIQRQDADQLAQSTLTRTFQYSGRTFSINDDVTTNIDLGHTDYIAYYEILDNWVSLDLGINVKHFDGNINLSSSTSSVSDKLNDFVPMIYSRAQFEFPTTNFSVDIEASFLTFGGDSLTDIKAALAYESDLGFGAEVGFKQIKLNVDNLSDIVADVTFKGAFLNLKFHF